MEMAGSPDFLRNASARRRAPPGSPRHQGRHEGRTNDRSRPQRIASPACWASRSRRRQAAAGRCADGRPPPPVGPSPGARPGHPSRRTQPRNRRIRAKRTHRLVSLRGRAGRREQDDVDPARGADRCERPASSTGRSGRRARRPPTRPGRRRTPRTAMVHDVGIGHDRDRDVDRSGGDRARTSSSRVPRSSATLDASWITPPSMMGSECGCRPRSRRPRPRRAPAGALRPRPGSRPSGRGRRTSRLGHGLPEGRLQPVHQRRTRMAIMFRRRRARRARYRGPCRRVRKGSPVPAPPPGAVDGGAIRSRAPARAPG